MTTQNTNQNATQTSKSSLNAATGGVLVNSYISSQSGNMQQTNQQAGQQTQGQMPGKKSASKQGQTVIGVFEERGQAENAVAELRNRGFTTEEINIVSKEKEDVWKGENYEEDDITDGALTGGTIGGIGGLLLGAGVVASVGAMAIPGIGPIIASGPIAAAIGGAVAGGIAGGLIDWGIPEESSERYERSVAEGDILAIIRTPADKADAAAKILRNYGASDVESHNLKQQ